MAEQRNRWNWEISGFEPRKPVEGEDPSPPVQSLVRRRYSVSAASAAQSADPSRLALADKVMKLKDQVKVGLCFSLVLLSFDLWGFGSIVHLVAGRVKNYFFFAI